ncbi:MAG: diaminopimelate decarboxylase [Thermoplasmatales archaeon]|nr:diaminopimelate decarboxylase [Thermoplasmatales archaeon]
MREYDTKDGVMLIGGVPATDIAEEFGTPVYVTDADLVRENYRSIHGAFNRHLPTRVHYACKANTNLAVLRLLQKEGSHIDAVSIGEVLTCVKARFDPGKILYTGTNVTDSEMEALLEAGCRINVDSESQLERLARITTDVPLSFRVTPGVASGHGAKVMTGGKGSKFGIPMDRIVGCYARANELGFRVDGLHAHTGSGGNSIEPFIDVAYVLCDLANEIEDKVGIKLDWIDIGGGFGVPYRPHEPALDLDELAIAVTNVVKEESSVGELAIEPGRYVVCDTTVLLARCVDVKDAGPKKYVGVDAGMNTLMRPSLYDSYHHVALANKMHRACVAKYDVVGQICESGDILARDRVLPDPRAGDLLAVYCAGAYSFSMSNEYNSRPRCAEVMVIDGRAELTRAAEPIEDLWRHQTIPEALG